MFFINKPVPKHSSVHVKSTADVKVENVHNDVPEFKRVYTANLINGVKIKVTIKTFCGSRFKSGELTQADGRWVTFDVDRIADKILDPNLLPLVEKCCHEINRIDQEFMATDPTEYIDEHGKTWRRVD